MPTKPLLVSLATAWGPKHGGINAFNVELMRILGVTARRGFELICVVIAADSGDSDDAKRDYVELLDLGQKGAEFADDAADAIQKTLGSRVDNRPCIWIGHDTKSGHLALQLRKAIPGSRAVLIHHMAFGAYQEFKKDDGTEAKAKREEQLAMFMQADLCIGIGPMLVDQLGNLLATEPKPPPIAMLVPGLAEPDPAQIKLSDTPPKSFTAFVAGRLGGEDDRIKQGELAVRGYAAAVHRAFEPSEAKHPMRASPTLRMRGVPAADHGKVKAIFREIGARDITFDLSDFTENRAEYFSDLAGSSVAMMPSWHEGFGLTAWEAIACQVPVVIGEQSGVYRLLQNDMHGMGLDHSVLSIAVAGYPGEDGEPNHTDADVSALGDRLFTLASGIERAKRDAANLPRLLKNQGYTWRGCADSLIGLVRKHLEIELLLPVASAPVAATLHPTEPASDAIAFLALPVKRPWQANAGFPTSALLVARDKIVRFDPERDAVVEALIEWLQTPATPLAFRLLAAPAGMGKTRTALELTNHATKLGRRALWLADELPADWETRWTAWWNAHCGERSLLIIDYAEARPEVLLNLLKPVALSAREGNAGELRILLLSRTSDWWRSLPRHPACSAELADLLAGHTLDGIVSVLPPWSSEPAVREESYRAALQDYAHAQGQQAPAYPYLPNLSESLFERPLYLHLAALAALDGERPQHAQALIDSQLRREWHYWKQSQDGSVNYDDWADALAWVGLAQGSSVAAAQTAFAAIGIEDKTLAKRLVKTYPIAQGMIAALQPDLLLEALLRERLTGERGPGLLAIALEADGGTAACLALLGRLAESYLPNGERPYWQSALRDGLVPAWERHPQALVNAAHSSGIGFGFVVHDAWTLLRAENQDRIAPALALPFYSTPLLDLAVSVSRVRLRVSDATEKRAAALNNLAVRLSARGGAASRTEALACAREAADTYLALVKAQPAVYLPDLAMSLNNLAIRLADMGDAELHTEALACAHKAVDTYRVLAEARPAVYLPDLAMSLNNLANHLSEQDNAKSRAEALTCAREAVDTYRMLAEAQAVAYLPNLAMSLNNLANRLSEQGDTESRTEALACAREAVNTYSTLAEAQQAAYLPDLAMSLNNLAIRLSEQDDAASRTEALACAREAFTIYSITYAQTPPAFERNLRVATGTLATIASMLNLDVESEINTTIQAALAQSND